MGGGESIATSPAGARAIDDVGGVHVHAVDARPQVVERRDRHRASSPSGASCRPAPPAPRSGAAGRRSAAASPAASRESRDDGLRRRLVGGPAPRDGQRDRTPGRVLDRASCAPTTHQPACAVVQAAFEQLVVGGDERARRTSRAGRSPCRVIGPPGFATAPSGRTVSVGASIDLAGLDGALELPLPQPGEAGGQREREDERADPARAQHHLEQRRLSALSVGRVDGSVPLSVSGGVLLLHGLLDHPVDRLPGVVATVRRRGRRWRASTRAISSSSMGSRLLSVRLRRFRAGP